MTDELSCGLGGLVLIPKHFPPAPWASVTHPLGGPNCSLSKADKVKTQSGIGWGASLPFQCVCAVYFGSKVPG